jgi:hypothetical protein
MPVIGLTFNSVEAKRGGGPPGGEIKVNSTPRIVTMKEVNVATLKKKALSLGFEFVTSYNPDIGQIKIGGEILYLATKNATILNQWKKKKRLPEKVSVEVLNHLFRRCLLKIANIAEDLQLPPPLQLPRVRPAGQQSADYVG